MVIRRTDNPGSGFESRQLPLEDVNQIGTFGPTTVPQQDPSVFPLTTGPGRCGHDKEGHMARYNTARHQTRPAVASATSPIATVSKTPDTRTFQGAPGHTRTAQSELFLRAAGAFGGENSFYENGKIRDARLRQLVRTVVREDYPWLVAFATWLRGPGNMRTNAHVIAVEAVHEDLTWLREVMSNKGSMSTPYTNDGLNRQIIDAVCQRPDEPGEILAIWTALYGRRIPKPVKRGLGDAVRRLYNERALLKYDTASHAYRFGDILNLVHAAPDPTKPWQGDLFQYALDRRHHPETAEPPAALEMIRKNAWVRTQVAAGDDELLLSPETLKSAGMTWEAALSLAGDYGPDKKSLWEALIPTMGVMALIRNLRNFDQAGVSDEVAQQVIDRLTDPQQIAESRQFPFRFLSAYQATRGSLRWSYPLEKALNLSLRNVPALPGRTLVLVDRSGSMFGPRMSERSDLSRADGAAIFGTAIALRAESADLVQFGTTNSLIRTQKGDAVLSVLKQFRDLGGTYTTTAAQKWYANHDRVIIITDGQSHDGDPGRVIPANVPVYTWNLAAYTATHGAMGTNARFELGGLTDKAFALIPLLEAGAQGVWPWELAQGD
jgi:hypothetical protein